VQKSVWIVVVLLVIGCGNKRPSSEAWPAMVVPVDSFSDVQKEELRDIADELNTLSGQTLVTEGEPQPGFSISILLVDPPENKRNRAGYATLTDEGCEIQLSKFLYEPTRKDYLRAVFLHELGHCAGLDHDNDPTSLMYPTTNRYSEYTPEALSQFAAKVLQALGRQ